MRQINGVLMRRNASIGVYFVFKLKNNGLGRDFLQRINNYFNHGLKNRANHATELLKIIEPPQGCFDGIKT